MHSAMLANLASTIALHGPSLLTASSPIPAEPLQAYWVASRNRFARWHHALGLYKQYELCGDSIGMRSWWDKQQPMLEEILVSEILTRTYAALGTAIDEGSLEPEVGPVVHSIFVSHLEARNRVLQIMVSGRGASTSTAGRLNRLRQTVERWADLLIGQILVVHPKAGEYANRLERATEFAMEVGDYTPDARQTAAWLMAAAMQDSIVRQVSENACCPDENQRIADSVLVCLRPDLFDSCGSLQSLWLYRLKHLSFETDSVVRELMSATNENAAISGFEAIRHPQFQKRLR